MEKILTIILHALIVFLTLFLNYALFTFGLNKLSITLAINIDICFIVGYLAYYYIFFKD